MSRISKSIKVQGGYSHRDHRSKKGQVNDSKITKRLQADFRRKKEELFVKSLEENLDVNTWLEKNL